MSPLTIETVQKWAQTIVLTGTVIVSCVVLVFKFGGYANRIESAIERATALGTQAITENVTQQKTLDVLTNAEARRQKAEDRADERREAAEAARRQQAVQRYGVAGRDIN